MLYWINLKTCTSEGFFPGMVLLDFSKIFPEGDKNDEIWVFPLEIKQTTFVCWNFQNPGGPSPPSDAHPWRYCATITQDLVIPVVNRPNNLEVAKQFSRELSNFTNTLQNLQNADRRPQVGKTHIAKDCLVGVVLVRIPTKMSKRKCTLTVEGIT